MKKFLLLVFAATLVMFFTETTYAQKGMVKVKNNKELVKALNDPNVESVEFVNGGFYDAILRTVPANAITKFVKDGKGDCTLSITKNNECWGDANTKHAVSAATSGSNCPSQPSSGSYGWYSTSTDVTFYYDDPAGNGDQYDYNVHFSATQPGVYTVGYRWNATNKAEIDVYLYSDPQIDWLFSEDTVCGLSTNIHFMYNTGIMPKDTIVKWYVNGTEEPSFPTDPDPDSVFTFTAPSCGAYEVVLHVTTSDSCEIAKDTINIYFRDTPVVDAGADSSKVCGLVYGGLNGSYTINCTGAGSVQEFWSADPNNPGTATFNSTLDTVEVSVCGEYKFYYKASNGLCSATDSIRVFFYDTPVVDPDVNTPNGDTVEVCGLSYKFDPSYTVNCSMLTPVTEQWSSANTGATFVGDSVSVQSCGTYKFYYEVTNGPCSTTDSIMVKFYDTPFVDADVTAQNDTIEVCGTGVLLHPDFYANCLNGDTIATSWQGTGLTFVGDSAYAASCGTYTAYITAVLGPCTAQDSVVLLFYDEPQVNAGQDDTICGLSKQLGGSYTVNCTNGSTTEIAWSKLNGPGTVVFTDTADLATQATVDTCGIYEFELKITNGTCVGRDTVKYYFTDEPTVMISSADSVCGYTSNISADYNVNCAIGDTGILEYVSGPSYDTIIYNQYVTSGPNYEIRVNQCGVYEFKYTVVNGACSFDTSFNITFFDHSQPVIHGDTTAYACSVVTYTVTDLSCSVAAGSSAEYSWTISGGYFDGGTTTTTGDNVTVHWGNVPGSGYLHVTGNIGNLQCDGQDSYDVTLLQPTLEGQVKYWNSEETYMPSPFSTDDYYTIPFDYFYVVLGMDSPNGWYGLDTAYVQPRLMEDLTELMSYFKFNLDTYTYGCDAEYSLRIWDGGFIYHNNPPVPAENAKLGNTYTYNNWGGVNATDALAMQLMATNTDISGAPYNYQWIGSNGLNPTYGYYSNGVADVNQSGAITALDALTAKYRAVGLIGSYPDNGSNNQFAPNFMVTGRMVDSLPQKTFPLFFDTVAHPSTDVPFNHSGNEYMYFQAATNHAYTSDTLPWGGKANYINIYYEAVGDVNASFTPPGSGLKAVPTLDMDYEGVTISHIGDEVTIPVSINRTIEAGAITLSFNYRSDLIQVLGTNFNDDDVMIDQDKGMLNIAWFNTTPRELNENTPVALIKVKVLNNIPVGTELFTLNANSELADAQAQPFADVTYKTIGVTTDNNIINTTDVAMSNYPNPFNNTTTVSYTLPENGKVKVEVFNSLGMKVATLVDDQTQEAGVHTVDFSAENVKSGVYVCRITVQGETTNYSAVNRMVVVH